MNVNDKTKFAGGPLDGQELRDIFRADRIEGDAWEGHYDLVTVTFYSEEDREQRVRLEYRYRPPVAAVEAG